MLLPAAPKKAGSSSSCIFFAIVLGILCFRPGEASVIKNIDKRIERDDTSKQAPIVWTSVGRIQGRESKDQDTELMVHEYLGIPYADTPKRFERAKYPPSYRHGIFYTNKYGSQCPLVYSGAPWFNTSLSEDCLFLNVYVPRGEEFTRKHPLPVLVIIHPGGFEFGNANSFDHRAWTSRGIIVVSIAYRLGVFGWATTATSLLPGNLGLWDQNAALQWIYKNIEFFDGDQERITISGTSAGAVSVISHLLSPFSRGLFKRVMAISGSALANWGTRIPCDKVKQYARWINNFARSLNCSGFSDLSNLECLRKAKMMDLIKASHIPKNLDYRSSEDRWAPVVDGEFIPGPPIKLYRDLEFEHIDLMVGSGYDDARSYAKEDYAEPRPNVHSPAEFYKWRYNMNYHLGDYVRKEAFRYYGLNQTTDPNSQAYTELLTDESYGAAQELDAFNHARFTHGRTYSFIWRHRPSFSHYESWVKGEHRDLLYFWLGLAGTYFKLSRDELRHEQDLLDYQANFIETGDPNNGRYVAARWPQYRRVSHERYVLELQIPTKNSKAISDYWGLKPLIWRHLWEKSYGNEPLLCPYAQ